MPARSPYVAMGEQITLQFGYRDLFGNQLNSRFQYAFDLHIRPTCGLFRMAGDLHFYTTARIAVRPGTLTIT